jgi:hypothetical protein
MLSHDGRVFCVGLDCGEPYAAAALLESPSDFIARRFAEKGLSVNVSGALDRQT